LNAADDKEEGFEHGPYYIRPAGCIKTSLGKKSLSKFPCPFC
jgi:hypothetical protein